MPTHAAVNLLDNDTDEIDMVKSNKIEAKALKEVAEALADALNDAPNEEKAATFCKLVVEINEYLQKNSSTVLFVRHVKRKSISLKLAEFRERMLELFHIFQVGSAADLSATGEASQKAATEASEEDRREMQTMSSNLENLIGACGLPQDDNVARKHVLEELEAASQDSSEETNRSIINEGIQVLRISDPEYDWRSATFRDHDWSYVTGVVSQVIGDIFHDLNRRNLLPNEVRNEFWDEDKKQKKTKILFQHIDQNHRNIRLVRSFQVILARRRATQDLLFPELIPQNRSFA